MTLLTGTLNAGGHLARSADGRRNASARWPIGEQHAVDRHGRSLCGSPVRAVFDDRPWQPDGDACAECARLAGHVDRIAAIIRAAAAD